MPLIYKQFSLRSCGREAEGGGLLNRYRVVKPYRGFESLRLRHPSPCRASGGRPPGDGQGEGCLPKLRQERRETVAVCGTFIFLSSATATSTSAPRTIFGVDLHLISKAGSRPRASTCRQFFARMWRLQMKRRLAAWSDISNRVRARPLPRSASCRRANDERAVPRDLHKQ
jgi:hypothetical protein